MADILIISRLLNGVQRNVDISSNTLVTASIKVGGAGGTELTEAILDTLIAFPGLIASTTVSEGASLVGINDAGTLFTATQVEAALAEVKTQANTSTTRVGHLVTLSGVAADADDLGTFTGTTIPNSSDIKEALQALETELEGIPSPFYYAGTWVASTNTPTLADGAGTSGAVYYVTDAGTVDFGAGNITFAAGDRVVYNGATWDKWDTTDAVASVNGQTGVVSLDTDDVSEGATNKYFSVSAARSAAVLDTLAGSQTDQAPSVRAVNDALAAVAPGSLSTAEVAGEAFAAATLFVVRYAKAADAGFVAGRMYKADLDSTSADNFYAIGLIRTVGSVSAAGAVTVVKAGNITSTAHGFTVGLPLYLSASGAVTQTAPSTALHAVVKVGMIKDANTIDVQIQLIGIN